MLLAQSCHKLIAAELTCTFLVCAVYRYRDFTTDPDRFDASHFKAFVDK
jgi:hypothetical protein